MDGTGQAPLAKQRSGRHVSVRDKILRSSRGHTTTLSGRIEPPQDSDHTTGAHGSSWYAVHLPRKNARPRCDIFIDHQSVCCALVKGCSRSWDIQLLATSWQLLCLQLGCRVWIEWVPSESNPADILSHEGETLYATQSGLVDPLLLPSWVDVASSRDIRRVFDAI